LPGGRAVSDWPWVIASYGLTWFVLGFYALWILRRLQAAGAELEMESHRSNNSLEVDR